MTIYDPDIISSRVAAGTATAEEIASLEYLDVSDSRLTALPDGLSSLRHLDVSGTPLASLPDGLSSLTHIYASDTRLASLPDGLSSLEYLDARDTRLALADDGEYTLHWYGGHWFAGCRRFTTDEALHHWGPPREDERARLFHSTILAHTED